MPKIIVEISNKAVTKVMQYMEKKGLWSRSEALNKMLESYVFKVDVEELQDKIIVEDIEYTKVKEYPGLYVTPTGIIYDSFKKKEKRASLMKNGYLTFQHRCNGNNQSGSVHRLVALTFVKNPKNKRFVRHIDEDYTNNYFTNLKWSDVSNTYYKKK